MWLLYQQQVLLDITFPHREERCCSRLVHKNYESKLTFSCHGFGKVWDFETKVGYPGEKKFIPRNSFGVICGIIKTCHDEDRKFSCSLTSQIFLHLYHLLISYFLPSSSYKRTIGRDEHDCHSEITQRDKNQDFFRKLI